MLQLDKEPPDRAPVGCVFRQKDQPDPNRADGSAHHFVTVAGKLVNNKVIVVSQRQQHPLDIEAESDRSSQAGLSTTGVYTLEARPRDERHAFPVAVWCLRL